MGDLVQRIDTVFINLVIYLFVLVLVSITICSWLSYAKMARKIGILDMKNSSLYIKQQRRKGIRSHNQELNTR